MALANYHVSRQDRFGNLLGSGEEKLDPYSKANMGQFLASIKPENSKYINHYITADDHNGIKVRCVYEQYLDGKARFVNEYLQLRRKHENLHS